MIFYHFSSNLNLLFSHTVEYILTWVKKRFRHHCAQVKLTNLTSGWLSNRISCGAEDDLHDRYLSLCVLRDLHAGTHAPHPPHTHAGTGSGKGPCKALSEVL